MSCILVCILVGFTLNVAYASPAKYKIETSAYASPKITIEKETVYVSDYIFANCNYGDAVIIVVHGETATIKRIEKYSLNENTCLKPVNLRLRCDKIVHYTSFNKALPKGYLLPPKNTSWQFGSTILKC